jgi:sec-independent protein translocase protein TatB
MPARLDRPVGERFRRLRDVLAILNSLGAGEAIAILVIALIVLGPEKLPDAIRKFGNIYGELRRMSHGFQSELRDAFDEPLRELRGTAQMMQDAVNEPARAVKAEMTAPVVGGGKQTKPAEKTEAPTDTSETPTEESQAPVEESQAPVDDVPESTDEVQASVEAAAVEGNGGPPTVDEGQPVLAQAGLLVSEPELAVPAATGRSDAEARAGTGDGQAEGVDGADGASDHERADTGGVGADELADGPRDD